MPDITISTKEEQKPVAQDNDIKEVLKSADEYRKLKEDNDKLEQEILRGEQLRARSLVAGKANAGQYIPEKNKEDEANEEATKILKMFR